MKSNKKKSSTSQFMKKRRLEITYKYILIITLKSPHLFHKFKKHSLLKKKKKSLRNNQVKQVNQAVINYQVNKAVDQAVNQVLN